MRSIVNETSATEQNATTEESSSVYYYFEDYDRSKKETPKGYTIVGGSTEVSAPDIDLDPYDQLHEDPSKAQYWNVNKYKGKGKFKGKGKLKFVKGKGKGKFPGPKGAGKGP